MRTLVALFAGLVLASCNATTKDGTPITTDGSLVGFVQEAADPGATYKRRQALDDAKCSDYGFKPGSQGYADCRLKLEHIRASDQVRVIVR
jgi:hypothetical protein